MKATCGIRRPLEGLIYIVINRTNSNSDTWVQTSELRDVIDFVCKPL